ncbi:CAP domain-containing protein [Chloroflexota bacterium]
MKRLRESLFVLLGFVLGIVLIVGCAASVGEESPPPKDVTLPQETTQVEKEPEVKQEQNEQVNEDCDAIRSELESLQAKYGVLQSENNELDAKNNALTADLDELNAKLNTSSTDYEELTNRYNNLLEGTPDITESELEQAIFMMINKERKDSGLNELEWTDNFYQRAKEHSNYLANKNLAEVSEHPYWQDVFRAAGYSSLDRITKAAWMVWKETNGFAYNFFNQHAKFGTVAVSISGDIFYITYFADSQK